ncbi:phosphopantothenoylcysteine decarboxylase [Actinomadura sp. NBRC 104425]|uniref:bifunctional phosphopantothenoylcysteine decarboxylase/phosphopantothenate--cysteine ligase CoaBC n=1 Tax=Actinomadura sp. NBRC 104425 TaxID=3032204 RepID=UPI0024A0D831|nr:bifunctional phosphopantothenoylcysteine decarboxylase/phosphopantothenate--cysteine ligase CoaBC [Actinomadura sp. NBRC 104425]GLZ10535.1 phosphopantothenoylcysteine decarboxylase [Actinomadura sp. NBRC 104425]
MTDPRPRVVLGVGAGIAAYKVCELLRRFTESGHDVRVVPTADALRFVGAATWEALSGHPVSTRVWDDVDQVAHVRLGKEADLVFVAPATADLLARAAHGRADDLLTGTLLTARCPVVFAPAMHTEMWEHPATQDNVAVLRSRGAIVVDPASGRLTGADTGPGRLPEPAELFEVGRRVLARGRAAPDLAGRHVVISAGGTREAIDPVRFIGNRSSGLQGYALARTAVARGARVTVVAANVALPDPAGARVVAVESAAQMRAAVLEAAEHADAVVMAAAVADFRPADYRDSKIKKVPGAEPEPIRLVKNPDILAELSARPRGGQVVVGFAAETDDVLNAGREKLARKGCDLLVVNEVGAGLAFGRPDNAAVVLAADGAETPVPRGPKEDLADVVWDLVAERLKPGAGASCPR